jgi:hypothetical protein
MTTINTQADVERIMVDRNVSFVFQPLLTEQSDGTWVGRYPGADWSVTATSEHDARAQLRAEELRRVNTPDASRWKVNAVRQHIEHGPIAGVYELDNTAADRAIQAGTPEAMAAEIQAVESSRGT